MRSSAYDRLKHENKRLFLILPAFKLLTSFPTDLQEQSSFPGKSLDLSH